MDFNKFEEITGVKIHHQFKRGLINCDRYINEILKCIKNNEKFYLVALYTPTKLSINLSDINQFFMLKWLQDVFNVPVIIHVNDNHRFLNDSLNKHEFSDVIIKDVVLQNFTHMISKKIEDVNKMSLKDFVKLISNQQGQIKEEYKMKFNQILTENCIKEIISIGFDISKTFICRNLKYIGQCSNYYETIVNLGGKISLSKAMSCYKTDYSDDIETISLASKDISAIFASSYPHIFNNETNIRSIVLNFNEKILSLSRRLAYEMKWPKPASINVTPIPSLHGNDEMQSCVVNSAIFFNDNSKTISKKINKFAFSGGKVSVEEHERLGGDCNVDIPYQYMRYFLSDDVRLETVRSEYTAGKLLTGKLKEESASVISNFLSPFQKHFENVSNDILQRFMTPRALDFGGKCLNLEQPNEEPEDEETETAEPEIIEEKLTETGDVVTPWEVMGDVDTGIDYDKLIERYGSSKIEQNLVDKFEEVTGKKAHHFLRRGMFYSHREFNEILETHRKGQKFFLYTGRGPSSDALHLGHMIPFIFTKWLQDMFDVPLVIQLTDDEKCLMRNISIEEVSRMAIENVKDIIAVGFDPKKTFIFRDLEYIGQEPAFFETAFRVGSKINFNSVKAIFGFNNKDSIEKIAFPPIQAAPSFSSSFPAIFGKNHNVRCLIPCAIDQDPYFRMTRDVAPRLNMCKPALIHSRFFPSLQGNQTKMSASNINSAIFMTDSVSDIVNKINNHAFTVTSDRKKTLTADQICQYDICYQYLTFFMEDQERLDIIKLGLQEHTLTDKQLKEELIGVLTPLVLAHQARRDMITDEMIRQFMTPRSLGF